MNRKVKLTNPFTY